MAKTETCPLEEIDHNIEKIESTLFQVKYWRQRNIDAYDDEMPETFKNFREEASTLNIETNQLLESISSYLEKEG